MVSLKSRHPKNKISAFLCRSIKGMLNTPIARVTCEIIWGQLHLPFNISAVLHYTYIMFVKHLQWLENLNVWFYVTRQTMLLKILCVCVCVKYINLHLNLSINLFKYQSLYVSISIGQWKNPSVEFWFSLAEWNKRTMPAASYRTGLIDLCSLNTLYFNNTEALVLITFRLHFNKEDVTQFVCEDTEADRQVPNTELT